MSETVPGTFQHSMQVANLAAEAANRIGAKSQLVRTGALYHDIGKMENPVFFTENQSGGVNPHKNLGYEQSAQVVISHVTDGLKLAEKNNLPKVIKDFITTHHGLGKTKYFYISWKNEHSGEEPNEELFTYPGPNPSTKEQAILMMAEDVYKRQPVTLLKAIRNEQEIVGIHAAMQRDGVALVKFLKWLEDCLLYTSISATFLRLGSAEPLFTLINSSN